MSKKHFKFQISGFRKQHRTMLPPDTYSLQTDTCKLTPDTCPLPTGRGFTLVEMLVAVSIFAIVMVVSVGTLIVVMTAGNAAQVSQSITSNLSFALDSMSRNIRTGYEYYCTSATSVTDPPQDLQDGRRNCTNGDTALVFTDDESLERRAYRYDSTTKSIQQRIEGEDISWITLTSDDLVIEELTFIVDDTAAGGDQPTIRILVHGTAADTSIHLSPYFIQTSVTSRSLDR